MASDLGTPRQGSPRLGVDGGWRFWAKALFAGGTISMVSGVALLLISLAPIFAPRVDSSPAATPPADVSNPFTVAAPTPSVPAPGSPSVVSANTLVDGATFVLRIPVLGYAAVVHQGVSLKVLATGPGHYPTSPWPGQQGNVGVAGHNTFWLSFSHLRLKDRVEIQTQHALYIYEITGMLIVSPTDRSVLAATSDDRLTLTTCYPLWAGALATKRLIFTAREIGGVA